MRNFYIAAMVLGTVIPWAFFTHYFATNGVDIPGFIAGLFANGAAGGFSVGLSLALPLYLLLRPHHREQVQ